MPIDLNAFGRYRLLRRVSMGGMAEVFKAKCYSDADNENAIVKVVALKRLLPTLGESEGLVEMFLQEAKLAARLDHQNVCRIHELGKVGPTYYISMEYIYGHDLREIFKAHLEQGRRVDPYIVAWVAARVSDALAFAWSHPGEDGAPLRLVHRDISPQNVMVGFDGTVKVIDFGIAKVANATVTTAAGVMKGKYAYVSPEQARREPLDSRSDIWSLGVVLHELLSSRRLFLGETVADTIDQVLHAQVPRLEGIPEALADVVAQMLERDLEARLRTHEDVASALNRVVALSEAPINERVVAEWMDGLFPERRPLEEDLTDDDVRILLSAEDRGEETTDQKADPSGATQIFLADTTGQGDYRAVLQRLLREGRLHTVVTDGSQSVPQSVPPQPPSPVAIAPITKPVDPRCARDATRAAWAVLGTIVVLWVLAWMARGL